MNIKHIVKQVINEYSYEKRLPFPEDEFKNKNYLEQYKDWLEDFGKYGTLPPSKLDFWEEIKKAIKYIIDNNLRSSLEDALGSNITFDKIYNAVENIMRNTLQLTNDNKVYVERKVVIDGSASTYDSSDSNGNDPTKLYKNLVDAYQNNVGGCWSYKVGGAESYCAQNQGDTITLKGLIRNEDIDFVKTVLLNFNYSEECEIRVKPKAQVELFEVDFNCKYKIPLRGHLIVTSTYFGNNSGYEHDYATVDDGFGHYQYMDRQGNFKDINAIVKEKLHQGISFDKLFQDIEPINNNFKIVTFLKKKSYLNANNQLIGNGELWFDDVSAFHEGLAKVELNNKYSFINTNGKLIGNGNLWFDYVYSFHNGFADVEVNSKVYTIDTNGNFYDYHTKKPIPNPLDNKQNETHFLLKKIINEEINKFILTENFDDNFGEYGELVYIKYNILKETDDEGYESEEYKIIEFMTLKGDIYKPNEICSYYELPDYFGQDVAFEMEDYECNENNLINHYKQDDNDVLEYSCYLQLNDIDKLRNTDPIGLLEKTYGTTDNFESAIWLLPNGTLLNGDEGNGYRTIDHNSVEGLLQMSCDQVMDWGIIRMMPESPGFEIHRLPTYDQERCLSRFIKHYSDDTIYVDFGNGIYAAYKSPHSSDKILYDIEEYFTDGVKPLKYN